MQSVDAFRDGLDAQDRALIDCLREIIGNCRSDLEESIKWNAPSFSVNGEDRITLGLERKGGVRIVLHLGAKVKDNSGFHFEDKSGLARWPAPDRGVLVFRDRQDVENKRREVTQLCERWLALTL